MTISSKWYGLDLSEDQVEVLDWLRTFCDKEIRPVGAKYHKLEETPWDIIKKAAECEIYSLDFFTQLFADQSGLTAALAIEELFRADAGIALAIFGTGLPAAAILANGTGEQIGEWLPKCLAQPRNRNWPPSARLSPMRARTSAACAPPRSTTKKQTPGP